MLLQERVERLQLLRNALAHVQAIKAHHNGQASELLAQRFHSIRHCWGELEVLAVCTEHSHQLPVEHHVRTNSAGGRTDAHHSNGG